MTKDNKNKNYDKFLNDLSTKFKKELGDDLKEDILNFMKQQWEDNSPKKPKNFIPHELIKADYITPTDFYIYFMLRHKSYRNMVIYKYRADLMDFLEYKHSPSIEKSIIKLNELGWISNNESDKNIKLNNSKTDYLMLDKQECSDLIEIYNKNKNLSTLFIRVYCYLKSRVIYDNKIFLSNKEMYTDLKSSFNSLKKILNILENEKLIKINKNNIEILKYTTNVEK